MIELAPHSKRGLELGGPLILAGGFGNEFDPAMVSRVHALLTLPVSLRARVPARGETRILEFPGGFLLHEAKANPGLAAVLQAHRLVWRRSDLAIILSLAGEDQSHWGQIARRASRIESIAALQLEIVEESDAKRGVSEARAETELPILAKGLCKNYYRFSSSGLIV